MKYKITVLNDGTKRARCELFDDAGMPLETRLIYAVGKTEEEMKNDALSFIVNYQNRKATESGAKAKDTSERDAMIALASKFGAQTSVTDAEIAAYKARLGLS